MDFTQPWDYGDVTFIIEEKRIYANKANLAMSSEVFKALFPSYLKEKMTEIPLPDKKFDIFLQLMQILHPPHKVGIDETNVASILPLAHEYQIHHVIKHCEKYLLTQPPSIHNLILADKFSLQELRAACMKHIKDIPYSKLEEDQDFEIIDKDILSEIIQCKLLEGEDTSTGVTYKLMSEPPSIQKFLLAEKYNVPDVYEKCLQYLKDTPLSHLKAEAGFTELKPDTVIEVLAYKAELFETLKTKVSDITNWGVFQKQELCSGTLNQQVVMSGCSAQHSKGNDKSCNQCSQHRITEIANVIKRY